MVIGTCAQRTLQRFVQHGHLSQLDSLWNDRGVCYRFTPEKSVFTASLSNLGISLGASRIRRSDDIAALPDVDFVAARIRDRAGGDHPGGTILPTLEKAPDRFRRGEVLRLQSGG